MSGKKINEHCTGIAFLPAIFLLVFSYACQRDDICPASTPTTPLLEVIFLDNEDPELTKPAANLRVRNVDFDTIVVDRSNAVEINLPLRTDVGETTYEFILNAPLIADGDEEPQNDESRSVSISFVYTRNEIYLNRACGFIVDYENIEPAVIPGGDTWFDRFELVPANLEDETNTFLIIYH